MNIYWNYIVILICIGAISNSIFKIYRKKEIESINFNYYNKYYFLMIILAVIVLTNRIRLLI